METKACTKCGERKPVTTQFFNKLSTGNWRGVCKTCMAANTKKHYDKDPQKVMQRVRKYEAQKAAAGGSHTRADVARIRAVLGDACRFCGAPLKGKGEVDHLTPVSRGGNDSADNITLTCKTCNRDKHSKTEMEFLAWRRKLGLPIRELS